MGGTLGVGVRALLAEGGHHIDGAPVVLHALLGLAHLPLLFGHLCSLILHSPWPHVGRGAVDFTHSMRSATSSVLRVLGQDSVVLQQGACEQHDLVLRGDALSRGAT